MKKLLFLMPGGKTAGNGGMGTYSKNINKELQHLDVDFKFIGFDLDKIARGCLDNMTSELLSQYEYIHAHDFYAAYLALINAPNKKIIVTFHLLHKLYPDPETEKISQEQREKMEQYVISNAYAIFTVSHALKLQLEINYHVKVNVKVINNGVGQEFYNVSSNNKVFDDTLINIGMPCRFVKQKGIHDLDYVFESLQEQSFQWEFHIAGEGPDEHIITKSAIKHGVLDKVTMHGWVSHDNMPAFYAQTDFTVSLTKNEPFGLSWAESIASGVPVIGRIVDGMQDYCIEGINSFESTPKNIGKVISSLIESYDIRPSNVSSSIKEYSWHQSTKKLLIEYELLVA